MSLDKLWKRWKDDSIHETAVSIWHLVVFFPQLHHAPWNPTGRKQQIPFALVICASAIPASKVGQQKSAPPKIITKGESPRSLRGECSAFVRLRRFHCEMCRISTLQICRHYTRAYKEQYCNQYAKALSSYCKNVNKTIVYTHTHCKYAEFC